MKIKGIFKNLSNAKGISIQLQTSDGEFIGKTDKVKKNKFNLSFKTPGKNEEKTGDINIVISDKNGNEANFKSKGKSVDLSPNEQTFTFNLNFSKKKARLKMKPKQNQLANQKRTGNWVASTASKPPVSARTLKPPATATNSPIQQADSPKLMI